MSDELSDRGSSARDKGKSDGGSSRGSDRVQTAEQLVERGEPHGEPHEPHVDPHDDDEGEREQSSRQSTSARSGRSARSSARTMQNPAQAPTSPSAQTSKKAKEGNNSSKKKKGKKSKKKKKKKPIQEDPKLVRDLISFSNNNSLEEMRKMIAGDVGYDRKYDLNANAAECLVVACEKGFTDMVSLILDNGGYPNALSGRSLQHAALYDQVECAELLLAANADVNAKSVFQEYTPIMFAAMKGGINMTKLLIKAGAKLDAQAHFDHCAQFNGWSALHFAADRNHLSVVEQLVQAGASLDIQSQNGDTALSISAEHGQWDVCKYLVSCGADHSAVRRGLSVVQWAIYRAAPDATQFLVSYGAKADLSVKALWFGEGRTLRDVIFQEFSEPIFDEIDLAIYRGSLQVKERAAKRKLVAAVRWEYLPPFDPYSFDSRPAAVIRAFPDHIVSIIQSYDN